jgi:MOSC domain-containing protein YiiM
MSAAPGALVLGVCLGPGGIPKHPVPRAQVGPLGLEGDRHRYRLHGGPDRAVCLLTADEVASLAADGVRAGAPGTFGENLLVGGLDPKPLRPGDRLAIGPQVVLELFDVRAPCRTLSSLDPRFPDLMLGRSGWVCRVIRGGTLEPGMPVVLADAGSPTRAG